MQLSPNGHQFLARAWVLSRERKTTSPNRMAFCSASVARTSGPTDERLFGCCPTGDSVRRSVGLPPAPTVQSRPGAVVAPALGHKPVGQPAGGGGTASAPPAGMVSVGRGSAPPLAQPCAATCRPCGATLSCKKRGEGILVGPSRAPPPG